MRCTLVGKRQPLEWKTSQLTVNISSGKTVLLFHFLFYSWFCRDGVVLDLK